MMGWASHGVMAMWLALTAPPPAAPPDDPIAAAVAEEVSGTIDEVPDPTELRRAHAVAVSLEAAIALYGLIEQTGGFEPMGRGRVLRPGSSGRRVGTLRRRLAEEGYLPPPDPTLQPTRLVSEDGTPLRIAELMDGETVLAVRAFQEAHGLEPDAVVGQATRRALDVPAAERRAALESSLASWLRLPGPPAPRFLLVNIPGFTVELFDAGVLVDTHRVIVGSPWDSRKTAVFSADLERVVFGPYWNVPRSIVPELVRKGVAGLQRRGFEVVDASGPHTVTRERLDAVQRGEARLRQRPGDDNALGRVKFDLPNRYAIYLHDTPTRHLFERHHRALSHGCVRVDRPVDLAAWVLGPTGDWPLERVAAAYEADASQAVDLSEPIPVHLVYWLASANGEQASFHPDLYRRARARP